MAHLTSIEWKMQANPALWQERRVCPWFPHCPEYVDLERAPEWVNNPGCGTPWEGEGDQPEHWDQHQERLPNVGPGTLHPSFSVKLSGAPGEDFPTLFNAGHVYSRPRNYVITGNSFVITKTLGRMPIAETVGDARAERWFEMQAYGASGVVTTPIPFMGGESGAPDYVGGYFGVFPEVRSISGYETRADDQLNLWRAPMFLQMTAGVSYYINGTSSSNGTAGRVVSMTSAPLNFSSWEHSGWVRVMCEEARAYDEESPEGRRVLRGAVFPLYKEKYYEACNRGDEEGIWAYLEVDYVPWRLRPDPDQPDRICHTGNTFGRFEPISLPPGLHPWSNEWRDLRNQTPE